MPYVVTCVKHLFGDICHTNLCKPCVGYHVIDGSKLNIVVQVKHRQSLLMYFKCPEHSSKLCKLHCEQCDIPICVQDTQGSRCRRYSSVFGKKERSLTSRFRRARKNNLSQMLRDCIKYSGSEGRLEKKHRTIDNSSQ